MCCAFNVVLVALVTVAACLATQVSNAIGRSASSLAPGDEGCSEDCPRPDAPCAQQDAGSEEPPQASGIVACFPGVPAATTAAATAAEEEADAPLAGEGASVELAQRISKDDGGAGHGADGGRAAGRLGSRCAAPGDAAAVKQAQFKEEG